MSPAIAATVADIVDAQLVDLPVQERFIRVVQPGRQRLVLVHVVLPADFCPDALSQLDDARAKTHRALSETNISTIVDILFTSDRQWGAPLAGDKSSANA